MKRIFVMLLIACFTVGVADAQLSKLKGLVKKAEKVVKEKNEKSKQSSPVVQEVKETEGTQTEVAAPVETQVKKNSLESYEKKTQNGTIVFVGDDLGMYAKAEKTDWEDVQKIDPSSFFSTNKGKKLLYIYSYPAVTAFGKENLCYKFAFENISASYLRNCIRAIQISVLQRCLMAPGADTPRTTLKIKVEETANSRPRYMHNVRGKITDDFAVNIFESDFKAKFLDKLKELKQ